MPAGCSGGLTSAQSALRLVRRFLRPGYCRVFQRGLDAGDDAGVLREQVLADEVAAGLLEALRVAGLADGDARGLLDDVDLPDRLDPVVEVVAAHAGVDLDELGAGGRDLRLEV